MNKIGKIIIALFVALIILFACWLLFVHIRGKGLSIPASKPTTETMSVITKLEGAQANKYILDEDKQNTIYTVHPVRKPIEYCYMDSKVGDTIVHSAYQNELYAVKIGDKWLYKYGVTGKEIDPDVRTKSYLWAEYASHNIKSKIEALGGLRHPVEIAPVHYTHIYQLDNKDTYTGIQIGAWLHIMEMSGHYALFKYLKTFHPNSTVMTISDNKFKLTNDNKIDILKQRNPEGLYTKITNALINDLGVTPNRVDRVINKLFKLPANEPSKWENAIGIDIPFEQVVALATMIKEANKFVSNGNNRVLNYDNLNFELKSLETSEFFCPLDLDSENYIPNREPKYARNISKELASIHRYIISFQIHVVKLCTEYLNDRIKSIQKDIAKNQKAYNTIDKHIKSHKAAGTQCHPDAEQALRGFENTLTDLQGKLDRRISMQCRINRTIIYRNKIDNNVIQMRTAESVPDELYHNFTKEDFDPFWTSLLKYKNITIHGSAKNGTYNGAHMLLTQQPGLRDIPLIKPPDE